MDSRTGAIITALQHVQLPPIMHPEQVDNRLRDRPLPIEPFATREPYATVNGPQYQQDPLPQQYLQNTPQTSNTQQSSVGTATSMASQNMTAEQKRNQEFHEHLRKSLINETQRVEAKLLGNISPPSLQSLDARSLMISTTQSSNNNVLAPSIPNGSSPASNTNRPYPPILPWSDDIEQQSNGAVVIPKIQSSPPPQPQPNGKTQKVRRKWTDQETKDLLTGCSIHGVGNWKKVLDDSRFNFNNRSSVDLKDRFRTCFPKEYKRHFGRAKSETPNGGSGKASDISTILVGHPEGEDGQNSGKSSRSRRRTSNSPTVDVAERLGFPKCFPKAQRRERKPFSPEEDVALLKGFQIYGPLWSKIQADKSLDLSHRRSTDLRDRFRNAYPDKYAQAGFKARPRYPPKPPRSGPTANEDINIDPLDSVGRNTPISSVESRHQFEPSTDVSGLDDFGLGPSSQLDDNQDDSSRKDEFNVSIMQDFLGSNSVRDWESNDSITGNGPSMFSDTPDARNTSPSVTNSMSVEPTLAEDFSASTLAHFDQQDLFHSPGGNGKSDAQDLVRWEDMVTHPIFALEAPSQGVNGVSMGMDGSVTLAPINPALLGGGGSTGTSTGSNSGGSESADSGVPGLSALLEEISNSSMGGLGCAIEPIKKLAVSKRKRKVKSEDQRQTDEILNGFVGENDGQQGGKKRRPTKK
ncbi:hypothetical protein BDZ91DRAFT_720159 [Kalaharituber pfeilii]|nr:hypothetical protein BDZ91DRAFT_720159 [Kalaharituber pfeilii]